MREAPSLGTAGVEQDGVEKELDRVLGQRSERLRETRGDVGQEGQGERRRPKWEAWEAVSRVGETGVEET